MSDINLYQALQSAMAQNVNDMKLSDCILGVVESASPLVIRIDQRTLIKSDYLILTDLVRDFSVDITVSHTTENRAVVEIQHLRVTTTITKDEKKSSSIMALPLVKKS